jgi:hypothetical protein
MSRIIRFAFVLILALVLVPAPSWAAGPQTRTTLPDAVTRFWSLLSSLWAEAGCILDPNGGCLPDQTPQPLLPQTDGGCIIDPSGGCSRPQPDEGCILDPSGRCVPRS